MARLLSPIKKYFLSGILVVVPIIITYLILKLLFNTVDDILQPIILRIFGVNIPGLGLVTTILLVFIIGIVSANLLGSQLVSIWDGLMERMPVIRPIYSASKQLMEAMTTAGSGSFKDVVMIEYPRLGIFALGFVAQRVSVEHDRTPEDMVTVFIPSTPTPMSGMVVLVPARDIIWLDMTVEAGLSYVVSGGVAMSRTVKTRAAAPQPAVGGLG
ncbi:MAG: DUF502 domain-containing protein [candidate division Zixibacteria bacterium]|nr:DUF502 domain-containing protein [candidate division Zixibacteria bacterium]